MRCDKCGTPINVQSYEELIKEFEENCTKPYGLSADAKMTILCDSCYQKCLQWMKEIGPEQLKIWEKEAKERGEF